MPAPAHPCAVEKPTREWHQTRRPRLPVPWQRTTGTCRNRTRSFVAGTWLGETLLQRHSQAVSGTRTIQRGNIARPPGVARCSDVVPDSTAPRWSAIVAATLLLPLEDIESRCTNVCVARWYANKLQCEPPASSANGLLLTGTRTTSEVRATCSSDEARSSPSAEAQHIGDKLSAFTLHRMCGRPGHQPSYTQTMLAPGCRNATLRSCLRPCTRYLHDTVHAHMNRAQRQLQAACKASAYQSHASP